MVERCEPLTIEYVWFRYPEDAEVNPDAVPGVQAEPDGGEDLASVTIEVDGEVFDVRPNGPGGTNYDWTSGPNVGYGFGSSPTPDWWSLEDHRDNIRSFLAQVDPTTGYIEDN